jgi:peroxiredoxin
MQLRLVFAAACSLLALAGCTTPRAAEKRAPEQLQFSLSDLSGSTVTNADFSGRVVLVDFWATWCKPCEESFPFYASLHETLGKDGFAVVAISVDAEDEVVKRFLARRPVPFTVLRDPEGKTPRSIEGAIETMPTAVLLGRDGRVRLVHSGFTPDDREKIEREVRAALAAAP